MFLQTYCRALPRCQVQNGLYIHLSSEHWHRNAGMRNPIIGSVCNEVESQTSTICVPGSRSISRGSRCSVNDLEGTVGIRIPTTSSVTTGAWEGPTGPVRTDPHCPTLAPGDLVPTTRRDFGTIATPDTQYSSVTIPASRSDRSRTLQSPATHREDPGCPLQQRLFGRRCLPYQ